MSIKKALTSPSINPTQFPLTLAWASSASTWVWNKVLLILIYKSKKHLAQSKYRSVDKKIKKIFIA